MYLDRNKVRRKELLFISEMSLLTQSHTVNLVVNKKAVYLDVLQVLQSTS